MYAVSEDYEAAIVAATRIEYISGTITLADTSTVTLENDIIDSGSMSISRGCVNGGDLDIGGADAAILQIGLLLDDDLEGATIEPVYNLLVDAELDTWEQVPLGKFYVADPKRESNVMRVIAPDGMSQLEQVPVSPPSSGTPFDYLDYAATQAGVSLEQIEATIEAMPNGTYTITYPDTSEIETLRDLVMWVSQLLAGFAFFNMDGKLEISQMTGAAVREIDASCRKTGFALSDITKHITALEWKVGGIPHIYRGDPDTGGLLSLEDSPLIRGETTAVIEGTLMPAILASVTQTQYRPFNCELCRPDPALEPGDLLTLSGGPAGAGVSGLLTNMVWQFRRAQSLAGAGMDNALPTSKTQLQKKDIIRADRAYIPEIIAEELRAGKKIIVGNATGKRAEIYLSDGSPLIDMYDENNTKRSSWGYDQMLWYDPDSEIVMMFDQYGLSFGDSHIQAYETPGGRTGMGFFPL